MVIAIDLDEVLSQTLTVVNDYFNTTNGTNFHISEFSSYEWGKTWGIPQQQAIDFFKEFVNSPGAHKIQPLTGATTAIEILSKQHELHVVTSRAVEYEQLTLDWINQYFPNGFHTIHILNHAHWSFGGKTRTKHEVCKQIAAEILIEDNIDYIEECEDLNMIFYLFDYPWNQHRLPPRTKRVNSWKEVINNLA